MLVLWIKYDGNLSAGHDRAVQHLSITSEALLDFFWLYVALRRSPSMAAVTQFRSDLSCNGPAWQELQGTTGLAKHMWLDRRHMVTAEARCQRFVYVFPYFWLLRSVCLNGLPRVSMIVVWTTQLSGYRFGSLSNLSVSLLSRRLYPLLALSIVSQCPRFCFPFSLSLSLSHSIFFSLSLSRTPWILSLCFVLLDECHQL